MCDQSAGGRRAREGALPGRKEILGARGVCSEDNQTQRVLDRSWFWAGEVLPGACVGFGK